MGISFFLDKSPDLIYPYQIISGPRFVKDKCGAKREDGEIPSRGRRCNRAIPLLQTTGSGREGGVEGNMDNVSLRKPEDLPECFRWSWMPRTRAGTSQSHHEGGIPQFVPTGYLFWLGHPYCPRIRGKRCVTCSGRLREKVLPLSNYWWSLR